MPEFTKTLKITIAVILSLFLILLVALPWAIDKNSLKLEIEQKITRKLGANFIVKGKTKVSFLPLPKITLNDITIYQLVIDKNYVSDVDIKILSIRPSFFSLFGENVKIAKLSINGMSVKSRYQDKIATDAENLDLKNNQDISDQNQSFDFENIKKIEFKNGSFFRTNAENKSSLDFNKINFSLENNPKEHIFNVEGVFVSNEEPTSFVLIVDAKNKDESSLRIQSSILDLSISGKFIDSNIYNLAASNFTGKMSAKVLDLKALIGKYISKSDLLYRKVNFTKPIEIKADLENKSGEISINNILIDSELMSGEGKISANFTEKKSRILAQIDFKNIDIDSVWFSGALNNKSKTLDVENRIVQEFLATAPNQIIDKNRTHLLIEKNLENISNPIFENFDFGAQIKIKLAKYYGGNIENIKLKFATKNDNFELENLSADIEGGILNIKGSLVKENNMPKFIGEIQAVGDNLQKSLSWLGVDSEDMNSNILGDYSFTSDLLILPSFNVFNDLNLVINNGKNIVSGNLKIDDSGDVRNSLSDLKVNYLDYEEYFLGNRIDQYLSKDSLFRKFLWINSINFNRDISLSFEKLIFNGNEFNDSSLNISSKKGYLKFSDLNFLSPKLDLKGYFEVDIRQNPTININLMSDNFEYSRNQNLADQFFALPAADEFSGEINFELKNLLLESWILNDVKISGRLSEGVMDFDNFNFKTYGGENKYKGSIIFREDKTINGSLKLVGIDSGNILSDLMGIDNISGISNISAILTSNARNKTDFFKSLDASGQFIGANINVKGFGIYDLALKTARYRKYLKEISNPELILYNPSNTSVMGDVSGAFVIKRGSSNQNQFSIKTSSIGINGVISGGFDVSEENIDGNANFIFLSGTRQETVPINISINFNGKSGDIQKNGNFSQISQYVQRKIANGDK